NADTVDPGIGRTRLGQRTLKCVFLIGTRSAHSIRASGLTAAQTGRTHDRTRPMLQQRQKVLAKAPSTHDPKGTLPGYPTEIIPVRVHLMHLLRSLDAGRQDHLKHRHADRRPCQFVLRLPIERYSGGSAQRWPAITYLERKLRTRDRCRLRDCRPITSEADARGRGRGLPDLARSTDPAGGAFRLSDNFRAARVRRRWWLDELRPQSIRRLPVGRP